MVHNMFLDYNTLIISCVYDILYFFPKDLMPAGLYRQITQLKEDDFCSGLDRKVNNEKLFKKCAVLFV